jgi:hypothetical protein
VLPERLLSSPSMCLTLWMSDIFQE